MPSKVSSSSEISSNSSLAVRSPDLSPSSMKSHIGNNNASSAMFCNSFMRRPRGEKRPIPEEQKDEKYFERRKRNNEAAKKSRDARKMREDRVKPKIFYLLVNNGNLSQAYPTDCTACSDSRARKQHFARPDDRIKRRSLHASANPLQ